MKKLIEKDKQTRVNFKKKENKIYVLKSIFNNFNFFIIIRWNAILKLSGLKKNNSKVYIINWCLQSINKKRFFKLTYFSRQIFLKIVKLGLINGLKKASW